MRASCMLANFPFLCRRLSNFNLYKKQFNIVDIHQFVLTFGQPVSMFSFGRQVQETHFALHELS